METVKILPLIRREMECNHISPADLARKLNINPSSVQGMLSRPTLQIQRLIQLSEIFHYNFFREIADLLPHQKPNYALQTSMEKENEELKTHVKALEMEVGILRQTLKEVISR